MQRKKKMPPPETWHGSGTAPGTARNQEPLSTAVHRAQRLSKKGATREMRGYREITPDTKRRSGQTAGQNENSRQNQPRIF